MAIGPHKDGGWEFPLSVLCKLENHKSWGYNSVQVQHPGGAGGGIISKSLKARESATLMSEGRRTRTSQLEKRERRVLPSSTFLFNLSPRWIGWCPLTLGRGGGSSLLGLLIHRLISSRNTITDTPEIIFYQLSGYPLAPVKLTHKINHHSWSHQSSQMKECSLAWGPPVAQHHLLKDMFPHGIVLTPLLKINWP